jgi:hypothetical protein
MAFSDRIRTLHRWLAAAFTIAFFANLAVNSLAMEQLALGVGLATIPLILLLMVTGWYLWVLPYLERRRKGSGAPG